MPDIHVAMNSDATVFGGPVIPALLLFIIARGHIATSEKRRAAWPLAVGARRMKPLGSTQSLPCDKVIRGTYATALTSLASPALCYEEH